MSRIARFDRDTRTVKFMKATVRGSEIGDLILWLRRVERHIRDAKIKDDGGKRWTFETQREGPPLATLRWGKAAVARFELTPLRPRSAPPCLCCGTVVETGSKAWRQAPGSFGGHSRARFCDACVQRGGKHARPCLKLIYGGAT